MNDTSLNIKLVFYYQQMQSHQAYVKMFSSPSLCVLIAKCYVDGRSHRASPA